LRSPDAIKAMSDVRHNNKIRLHTNFSPHIKYSKSLEIYDVAKSIRRLKARIEICPIY